MTKCISAVKMTLLRLFDQETVSVRQTKMYVEGFMVKLKKDTSYKGVWVVCLTLKELLMK